MRPWKRQPGLVAVEVLSPMEIEQRLSVVLDEAADLLYLLGADKFTTGGRRGCRGVLMTVETLKEDDGD